jgi:hypothetical protein
MEIVHYVTEDGFDPYQEWMDALRDNRPGLPLCEELTVLPRVISAITRSVGTAFRKCALISALGIECTISSMDKRLSCFFAEAISVHRMRISAKPLRIKPISCAERRAKRYSDDDEQAV